MINNYQQSSSQLIRRRVGLTNRYIKQNITDFRAPSGKLQLLSSKHLLTLGVMVADLKKWSCSASFKLTSWYLTTWLAASCATLDLLMESSKKTSGRFPSSGGCSIRKMEKSNTTDWRNPSHIVGGQVQKPIHSSKEHVDHRQAPPCLPSQATFMCGA